ncbi:hypothetical protein [Corynebacterium appendicis]|uniref:hypothetical protein n=1 Tax=Corynebacterium appendicis TaxID=163202 RepID=UPI00223A896A|nr:hypothetical protein [Corynebacterium appendicis]MCT1683740.1 hypothetical protein [Corynebacterium appendicis]
MRDGELKGETKERHLGLSFGAAVGLAICFGLFFGEVVRASPISSRRSNANIRCSRRVVG